MTRSCLSCVWFRACRIRAAHEYIAGPGTPDDYEAYAASCEFYTRMEPEQQLDRMIERIDAVFDAMDAPEEADDA